MDFLNNLVSQAQTWLTHSMMTPGSLWQEGFILAALLAAFLISRVIVWPREWLHIALNLLLSWVLSRVVVTLIFYAAKSRNRAIGVPVALMAAACTRAAALAGVAAACMEVLAELAAPATALAELKAEPPISTVV